MKEPPELEADSPAELEVDGSAVPDAPTSSGPDGQVRATPRRQAPDRPVIRLDRRGALWRASSAGLPNPRLGLTAAGAARRIQSDLDFEWRTGRPRRFQRAPR